MFVNVFNAILYVVADVFVTRWRSSVLFITSTITMHSYHIRVYA